MRKAFRLLDEPTEWVDKHTQKKYTAADDEEAEKQGVFNKGHSDRRQTFFQGSEKPSKRDMEENEDELADKDATWLNFGKRSSPKALHKGFTKAFEENEIEAEKPVSFERPRTFQTTKTGSQSVDKQLPSENLNTSASKENQVALKKDKVSKEIQLLELPKKNAALNQPEFQKDDLYAHRDLIASFAFDAHQGSIDSVVKSIVLEVFESTNNIESSVHANAKNQTLSMVAKMAKLQSEKPLQVSAHNESAKNSKPDTIQQNDAVTDDLNAFKYVDITYALKRAIKSDWKKNEEEQKRVGSWALQVLSQAKNHKYSEAFKQDGLLPLGRLVMQLMTSKTAENKFHVKFRNEMDHTTEPLQYADLLEVLPSLDDLNSALKSEGFQNDLQAFQNAIQIDENADVLLESFLENLRNDSLDEQEHELRYKTLNTNAEVMHDKRKEGKEFVQHKVSSSILNSNALAHTESFKERPHGEMRATINQNLHSKGILKKTSFSRQYEMPDQESVSFRDKDAEDEIQETRRDIS